MLILTKTCTCCGEEKEFTEFSRNKRSKWGFHNKCKACCANRVAEFHKNNPDKKIASARKHYLKNTDKIAANCKEYYLNNLDKLKAMHKEYFKTNKEKLRPYNIARCAKRRSAKLDRIPEWSTNSDFLQIKAIYKCADRVSKCLGIPHHVDHIIPLQGKLVSGLHTPNNLQIIPATINFSKGNKWELCK